MNKEELLKAIMELPKIETNNPISTMNSINVDDLMSAIDRLNKVPDYNDLLKENQELKQQLEEINKMIEKCGFVNIEQVMLNYCGLLSQQQEFINYLENESKEIYRDGGLRQNIFRQILQKYKKITGVSDENKRN